MDSPSPNSAKRHQRVRRQNASELAQDYSEAIQEIHQRGTTVRVTDLQEIFGVSHVTVIRALRRFEKQGIVTRSRTKGIELTEAGRKLATEAAQRHSLVVDFLRALGVSEDQSELDAEGIEHHLSEETMTAMRRFVSSQP